MDKDIMRLSIFCFYDKEGKVDRYVEFLISSLKEISTKLIIVINGKVNNQGKEVFKKYTNQILIRQNIGYDFGAYGEVLCKIREEDRKKWDEIVFCNDTFYGPFLSFDSIFSFMRQSSADFWGLNSIDNGFFSHLQSYFLVFRKSILKDDILYTYIKDIGIYLQTNDLKDIYAFFENGLFDFLLGKGYVYDSYTSTENYDIYDKPELCIKECSLPLLKKKCFSFQYYKKRKFEELLSYISKNFMYDVRMIEQNAERIYGYKNNTQIEGTLKVCESFVTYYSEPIPRENIISFIEENKDIYIYGMGVYARKIWVLFHKYMKIFKGFIVSDNQDLQEQFLYGYVVNHYSNIMEGSAIIIGCDLHNTREILQKLKKSDRVCVIWDKFF